MVRQPCYSQGRSTYFRLEYEGRHKEEVLTSAWNMKNTTRKRYLLPLGIWRTPALARCQYCRRWLGRFYQILNYKSSPLDQHHQYRRAAARMSYCRHAAEPPLPLLHNMNMFNSFILTNTGHACLVIRITTRNGTKNSRSLCVWSTTCMHFLVLNQENGAKVWQLFFTPTKTNTARNSSFTGKQVWILEK